MLLLNFQETKSTHSPCHQLTAAAQIADDKPTFRKPTLVVELPLPAGNGGDIELRGIFAIWSDTAFSCAELRLIQDRHAHAMGEQLSTLKSTGD
jgi:hypothetical protein